MEIQRTSRYLCHLEDALRWRWAISETIEMLSQCSNVYADTSFIPIGDAVSLVQKGFAGQMLFGTDAPINLLFYKDMSTADYIRRCISNLKDTLIPEQFETVMNNKFYQLTSDRKK